MILWLFSAKVSVSDFTYESRFGQGTGLLYWELNQPVWLSNLLSSLQLLWSSVLSCWGNTNR